MSYSYIDGEGVSQKIEGYMYAKNLKTGAFNNGWLYKATSAIQKLKTRLILKETDLIDGKVFSYVIPFSSFRNLIVRQNGEQKTVTGIEFTDKGFSLPSCSAGDEILVTLATLSTDNENARKAIEKLPELMGCQVHTTEMLSEVDKKIFKKLGIDVTSEPVQKYLKKF